MSNLEARKEIRKQLQTALAACEDKKAVDTRILELDPVDSGLTDYFLITSATNERQAIAIADEIEFKLKREYGMYPNSVEGRRQGEWILLDYVDFVVHVFQTEKRAFYDIERLRKSARPLSPEEFDAELKRDLSEKTRVARTHTKPAAAAKKKAPAKAVAAKVTKKVPGKKPKETGKKTGITAKKTQSKVVKKTAVTKSVKKAVKKVAKKAAVKKVAKKVAKKAPVKKTAKKAIKKPVKKVVAKKPVKKPAKKAAKKRR